MSARRVWVVTCEACEAATLEVDGSLSDPELGAAIKAAGWEVPVYGGTFCPRCARTVKVLACRRD